MTRQLKGGLMMAAGLALLLSTSVAAASEVDMYRLYNPNSGEHFYTGNSNERDYLASIGWHYEGIGWVAPSEGQDVYRLYNPNAGDHHYTLSADERNHLVKVGWHYEGVAWKSGGSLGLHRLYNPNAKAGSHHYSLSENEAKHLSGLGWHYEGISWYAVGQGQPVAAAPAAPTPAPETPVTPATPAAPTSHGPYASCSEVWASLGRPIKSSDPGYSSKLDKDGDGVGCEIAPK